MTEVIREHIEVVPGASGLKARIVGRRIRVQDIVVWHEKLGMSPDEIVHHYPTITLADVYAALAYYWDHREEIERALAEEQALGEEFRRAEIGPLQEKLKQRRRG